MVMIALIPKSILELLMSVWMWYCCEKINHNKNKRFSRWPNRYIGKNKNTAHVQAVRPLNTGALLEAGLQFPELACGLKSLYEQWNAPVLLFVQKSRLSHPENYLFSCSKEHFSRFKYPENILFNSEYRSTGTHPCLYVTVSDRYVQHMCYGQCFCFQS